MREIHETQQVHIDMQATKHVRIMQDFNLQLGQTANPIASAVIIKVRRQTLSPVGRRVFSQVGGHVWSATVRNHDSF